LTHSDGACSACALSKIGTTSGLPNPQCYNFAVRDRFACGFCQACSGAPLIDTSPGPVLKTSIALAIQPEDPRRAQ